MSQLDANQVIKAAFDDSTSTLKISIPGGLSVGSVKLQDGSSSNLASVSASGALKVDGSAVTQPVSFSGNVTVVQPTGTNLHTVVDSGTVTANIGTTNGLALDSSLSTIDTDIKASQPRKLQDGSGNAITSQASGGQRALDVGIDVAGVQVDPRSIRALTSSDVVTANAGTGNFTVIQTTAANLNATVVGTGTFAVQATGTVTANIGTTNGLALDSSLSTIDTDIKASQPRKLQDGSGNSITSTGNALDVNLKTSSITVSTSDVGYANSEFTRNDYSSVNVTTSAYTQLIASTANAYHEIHISDTSGQTLKLATGAISSEVDKVIIPPGGTFPIKLFIPSGTRISIKAVSATANTGEIDIQFLG